MGKSVLRRRRTLLAGLMVVLHAGAAHAAQQDARPARPFVASQYGIETVAWEKGQFVNLCNGASGRCQSVKMPKTLGKVESVVEGPLVASARASWIASTKFESFVCAALKGRTTVACARIDGMPPARGTAAIAVRITADNKTRVAFEAASKAGIDGAALKQASTTFAQALWNAAYVLQGEVDQAAAGMSSFASSLAICDKDPRYPGPPPHPDCELVEEGDVYMWSCSIPGTPWPPEPPPMPEPELPPCL